MKNKLKDYFPIIWERGELLAKIHSQDGLSGTFDSWDPQEQETFLDFCTGVKGIKLLYDAFFKEIMNPESTPERMNEFLSLLLGQEVKILYVLPNDSTRIADENTLLITDIVVELKDTGLANIEVQKIGYRFTGQRSACYSADLLLRQYKRVRSREKKKFSYKDIQAVYTIILYEKSPQIFHRFPNVFLHRFQQTSDSGLELELLQKYIFLPLDIFRKIQQNKPISNRLEAWLTFFSTDDPEQIVQLIKVCPDFRQMYQEAYQICRNMEAVMGIFSEELRELDRNTVQLMIDEAEEELKQQREELQQAQGELQQAQGELQQAQGELQQTQGELQQTQGELQQQREELQQTQEELQQTQGELQQTQGELQQTQGELQQTQGELQQQREELQQAQGELQQTQGELQQQREELQQAQGELQQAQGELQQTQGELQQTQEELILERQKCEKLLQQIAGLELQLAAR